MARGVLRPRPAEFWHGIAGHLPPSVDDVLAPHVTNFTRTLAGEQQDLERSPDDEARVVEFFPESLDFGLRQDALAALASPSGRRAGRGSP